MAYRAKEGRMKFENAVEAATKAAYEDVADYVVGRVGRNDNDWQIAHIEDMGTQAQMIEPKYLCDSVGIKYQVL
jgi:hypothetical protein